MIKENQYRLCKHLSYILKEEVLGNFIKKRFSYFTIQYDLLLITRNCQIFRSSCEQIKGRQQETVAAGRKLLYYFIEQSLQETTWSKSESSDIWVIFALWGCQYENSKPLENEVYTKLDICFHHLLLISVD